MKSKLYSIILTVLQIVIGVLCFIDGWASVKWNMKMEMWGRPSFYELWIFMPEHMAGMAVAVLSAVSVVLAWTPLKKVVGLTTLFQVYILLKSRLELTHDIWKKGTGYQDAAMLPLGNIHCIIVILTLVVCMIVNNRPKKKTGNN